MVGLFPNRPCLIFSSSLLHSTSCLGNSSIVLYVAELVHLGGGELQLHGHTTIYILFCCGWIYGFFLIWGFYKSCPYKYSLVCVLRCTWTHIFVGSGLAKSLNGLTFSFHRLCPTFSKMCQFIFLHYINFPCFTSDQHLVLSIFKIITILVCV